MKRYRDMYKAIVIFVLLFPANSGQLFAQGSVGAGVFAYPSADQSTKQISADSFDCHNWAVSKSDFDPTRDYTPEPVPYTPPPTKSGGSADRSSGQNAVRGAARGSVIGAVTGNAARGAVIGTATGVLFGKKKRNKKEKEEQQFQQQHQQQLEQQRQETESFIQAGTDQYRRAYVVCMETRNYKVQ